MRLSKLFIVLTLIVLGSSSCCTLDRCLHRHPELSRMRQDSTVYTDRTVYRDTVITIDLTGDSIQWMTPWMIRVGDKNVGATGADSGHFQIDTGAMILVSRLDGQRSSSQLSIVPTGPGQGKLLHELLEPDTSIQRTIERIDSHRTTESATTITQTVPEKRIPGFYRFTFYWFLVTAAGLLLAAAFGVYRLIRP